MRVLHRKLSSTNHTRFTQGSRQSSKIIGISIPVVPRKESARLNILPEGYFYGIIIVLMINL